MNTELQKDIVDFEKLVAHWIEAYKWKVCTYIAIKTTDGAHLLFGRIILEPSIANQSKFLFESEHLIAGHEIISLSQDSVRTTINDIKGGKLTTKDNSFNLMKDTQGYFSYHFFPIHHPLLPYGPRLPSIRSWGQRKHDLLIKVGDSNLLDWELKASDMPFDSLDDLLGHLGLPSLLQMGDLTTLELAARSPGAILDTSIIEAGQASVNCQVASNINQKKIKVGYKIYSKDKIERAIVQGDNIEWHADNDFQVGIVGIDVGEAPHLQAFLSYGGIALHQWWISDPSKHLNPRYAIHQTFDENMELIKDFLSERKESRNLESGLAMLLNILGFSVSHYGHIPKIQQGPDLVITTPRGDIGVIECTTGLLNEKHKLAKLVQRTKLIKERLESSGYGYLSIQPIIVSSLTKNEVGADLEEAGKHGIAVVCKENLENLLNQVNLLPNPDRLFEEARRLIPSVRNDSKKGPFL